MISQNTIQQILSRIDIIDIVGAFVKLKKRGTNYLGLCPFHNEKTPSFIVSPNKEIYKCFGCGKSGNAIGFIMDHEKYSYVEALRWLAQKYNVEVEETEVSAEQKQHQQVADSLYIINNFAQKYFSQTLFENEKGRDIGLSYLKERGFREETIKKFGLGYCLEERDAFVKTATANQFNLDLLQKTGLVVVRDHGPVDNYRGRVIFPIHNQSGKILGFGARIIAKNDRAPKYINTPENEIYVKSRILYGSYFARQSIDRNDECLLVEGYTDVISLHQAGIENVVASGGTSLTPDQLRLIKKYTKNLTIIYDGDSAGVKAAMRGLDLALEEGLNVQLVLIPDNEDPDSYVNKIGASAFQDFIKNNKKDFIFFQLEVLMKDAGKDLMKRSAIVNQVAETISKVDKVEDFSRQQEYIRQCSQILNIEEAGLLQLVSKFVREKTEKLMAKEQSEARKKQQQQPPAYNGDEPPPYMEGGFDDQPPPPEGFPVIDDTARLLSKDELNEKALVRCLVEFGMKEWDEQSKVADYILHQLDEEQLLQQETLLRIIDMYRTWYKEGLEPGPKNFLYHEDQELGRYVVALLDFPYELSAKWKDHYEGKIATREDLYKEDVTSTLHYLKLRKIKKMLDENQRDMQNASNNEEMMILIQTHQHLKTIEIDLLKQIGTVLVK